MPHITLNNSEPGIRGLLLFRPETAQPLSELTDLLLRGPSTLTRGERELIAAYVSGLNDCRYCTGSHSASTTAPTTDWSAPTGSRSTSTATPPSCPNWSASSVRTCC